MCNCFVGSAASCHSDFFISVSFVLGPGTIRSAVRGLLAVHCMHMLELSPESLSILGPLAGIVLLGRCNFSFSFPQFGSA